MRAPLNIAEWLAGWHRLIWIGAGLGASSLIFGVAAMQYEQHLVANALFITLAGYAFNIGVGVGQLMLWKRLSK